ncbi:MAG: RidA family protein [Bacteroidota bacterium]
MDTNNIEQKLNEMGLQFPASHVSKGIYKRCLTVGNFLFVSGHVSVYTDGKFFTGKVGEDLTEEQGKEAARQCALGMLCSIKGHLGNFDRLKRVVRLLGMVNSSSTFEKHALVVNGCSELFAQLMGEENGIGVRSSVGMGSLPGNVAVEVEGLFELEGQGS